MLTLEQIEKALKTGEALDGFPGVYVVTHQEMLSDLTRIEEAKEEA